MKKFDTSLYFITDSTGFTEEEFLARAQSMKTLTAVQDRECPVETDEGVRCRAGSTSFWMTWDGRSLPCGMMPHPVAYPLEDGVESAWKQIREETAKLRMPAKCSGCPKRGVCSVCAAGCVTETGRFDGVPEYVCKMTDAVIERTWQRYEERNACDED